MWAEQNAAREQREGMVGQDGSPKADSTPRAPANDNFYAGSKKVSYHDRDGDKEDDTPDLLDLY